MAKQLILLTAIILNKLNAVIIAVCEKSEFINYLFCPVVQEIAQLQAKIISYLKSDENDDF